MDKQKAATVLDLCAGSISRYLRRLEPEALKDAAIGECVLAAAQLAMDMQRIANGIYIGIGKEMLGRTGADEPTPEQLREVLNAIR